MVHLNLIATFKVSDIISAVERNKIKHREDFQEAQDAYFVELAKRITNLTENLKARSFKNNDVKLVVPQDATNKYDELLEYFRLQQNETVELSKTDYNTLVNDRTDWALMANVANSTYKSYK